MPEEVKLCKDCQSHVVQDYGDRGTVHKCQNPLAILGTDAVTGETVVFSAIGVCADLRSPVAIYLGEVMKHGVEPMCGPAGKLWEPKK